MGRVSINWNAFGCNEQLKTRKFITLRSVEMVTSILGLYSNVFLWETFLATLSHIHPLTLPVPSFAPF